MKSYSLTHLADQTLLRDLAALVARDRTTTAALLAHLAEVDSRRLYLPAGYPSMYAYCVEELRLSEDAAYKRIQAARIALQFPALFPALADGRLNLSGVVLLAPHLTPEDADELLGAAAGKSKAEIEELLALRFPRSEWLPMVEVLPGEAPRKYRQLAPGQVGGDASRPAEASRDQLARGQVGAVGPRSRVAPVALERFVLQLTMDRSTHDRLRYAQALLSHQIPNGDLAAVLDRALVALIDQLEKRKFAATVRPRRGPQRPPSDGRHIPAYVRRAVWERDGGQCTFTSEDGRRCPARTLLEFDHVDEVARGGQATVGRMRLRCRAHNQYGAERTFGVEFMRRKREQARCAAVARAQAAAKEKAEEVIPWLRALGFRAEEARRAAALCDDVPDASLEQRVRAALGHLAPRFSSHARVSHAWAGRGT